MKDLITRVFRVCMQNSQTYFFFFFCEKLQNSPWFKEVTQSLSFLALLTIPQLPPQIFRASFSPFAPDPRARGSDSDFSNWVFNGAGSEEDSKGFDQFRLDPDASFAFGFPGLVIELKRRRSLRPSLKASRALGGSFGILLHFM